MSRHESGSLFLSKDEILAIFSPDPVVAEQKYMDLFQSLARFFEWKRLPDTEDMAQETLKRGFHSLQAGGKITVADPAAYFWGIARNLVREGWRVRRDEQLADEHLDFPEHSTSFHKLDRSEQLVLLRQILAKLEEGELEMLISYLDGEGETWSQKAGMQAGTLRGRIHRLRKRFAEWAAPRGAHSERKR